MTLDDGRVCRTREKGEGWDGSSFSTSAFGDGGGCGNLSRKSRVSEAGSGCEGELLASLILKGYHHFHGRGMSDGWDS
jgi:hypothetical protein